MNKMKDMCDQFLIVAPKVRTNISKAVNFTHPDAFCRVKLCHNEINADAFRTYKGIKRTRVN